MAKFQTAAEVQTRNVPQVRTQRSMSKNLIRTSRPYLWLLPALGIYGIFKLVPLVAGIWLTLLQWDGISPPVFVGLHNFALLFTDNQLGEALLHNVEYALGTVTGKIVLSLLLALLLNQKLFGRSFYRTTLFLPIVMSFVVISLLWTWLYDYQFGLVNNALRLLGLGNLTQDWLGNPDLALWSEMIVDIWKWYGFHMVIFLTGLQTIPIELYEASRVDGASRFRQFFNVTLPLLQPVMLINLVTAVAGALNVFDIPYLMTEGGPDNATNVLGLHIYVQSFQFNKLGYGTTLSYALFVIVSVVVLLQLKYMNPLKNAAEGNV